MIKKSILRQHIAEAMMRLIREDDEQTPSEGSAAEEAHKLGLVSKGWGNWADSTGKVVAKTIDGKLVKTGGDEKPAMKPMSGDDPSGYSDTKPRALRPQRTGRTPVSAIDPEKAKAAEKDFRTDPVKAAYSSGGFGTHAGFEKKPHQPEQHPLSQVDVDKDVREAEILMKKHGGPEKAIERIRQNLTVAIDRYRLLEKHNTNTTPKRKMEMEKLHHQILRWTDQTMYLQSHIPKGKAVQTEAAVIDESEASDLAHELGLESIGWGRWIDSSTGEMVAKTVQGKLTRVDPNEDDDADLPPKVQAAMDKLFKMAGHSRYQPQGINHISPRWNKDQKLAEDDIPFDANGEETVKKLLRMIGDPGRLVRWLMKKYRTETPNGKQRIKQYLGIVKKMGLMPEEGEEETPTNVPTA